MNRNSELESKKKKMLQNRMEGKIWEELGKIKPGSKYIV